MKTMDVQCPICGKWNQHLNLEETEGWMECACCGRIVQILPTAVNPSERIRTQASDRLTPCQAAH